MKTIAITGNMGSGKSVVANIFEILGIPVYRADHEARKQYSNPEVIIKVQELIGDKVLKEDGTLDLVMIADEVFKSQELLSQLTSILHPLVLEDFTLWCSSRNELPYVALESAIIFENKLESLFDVVVTVSTTQEISISRVKNRDHLTEEQILERLKTQLSDEYKCEHADFVIKNDNSAMIIPQVMKFYHSIFD
ncbi:MAG: dephospho-CoA kinase [Bacteroidota bacterium]